MKVTGYAMSFNFTYESIVWNFIERFLEVKVYYVDCPSVVIHFMYVIEEN